MSVRPKRSHFANDVYVLWRARVRRAEERVRVFTPYLDILLPRLLSASSLPVSSISVVTDLSPESGNLEYRRQLIAVRTLLERGVSVRSLARLHAKVLLTDDVPTVGSQNFTIYARNSRETTHVQHGPVPDAEFLETLADWWHQAEEVDLTFIEDLLEKIAPAIERAKSAIGELGDLFDTVDEERRARLLMTVPIAQPPLAPQVQLAVTASVARTARAYVWARLRNDSWAPSESLMVDSTSDLTQWLPSRPTIVKPISLTRLRMYPIILNPSGRLGFARVAQTRISYVRDAVEWTALHSLEGIPCKIGVALPKENLDFANMAVSLTSARNNSHGVRLQFRFDGAAATLVGHQPLGLGRIIHASDGAVTERTADDLAHALADPPLLRQLMTRILTSFKYTHLGIGDRNAEDFFPSGWLRVVLIDAYDRPVLAVSDDN